MNVCRADANIQFCKAGNSIFYFTLRNDPSLLKTQMPTEKAICSSWVREPLSYNRRALVTPCMQDEVQSFFPSDPIMIPTLFLESVTFFFCIYSIRSKCVCKFLLGKKIAKILPRRVSLCSQSYIPSVLALQFSFQPRGVRS